jgi:pentatricopeptide repeat protein
MAGVEARREEEALGVLQEMVEKGLTVEAENLMALKFACEANAYDGCVALLDELLRGAVSEMQLQASSLGFGLV